MGAQKFSLTIPAKATTSAKGGRKPQYISASTLSAVVQVNGIPAATVDLSGAPNCSTSSGTRVCTFSVPAPIGNNTFSMQLYDGTNGSGAIVGSASNFMVNVVESVANVALPIIVGGVPASADIFTGTLNARNGSTQTVSLIVNAYDADGNLIVGPASYVRNDGTPITIDIAETINVSQIQMADGGGYGGTINVASPADQPTVQFSGTQDVLGVPLTVTALNGAVLPQHTASIARAIAVTGTLKFTVVQEQTGFAPVNAFYGPTSSIDDSSYNDGFLFAENLSGSGGELGYFSSTDETRHYCTYSGIVHSAVGAISSGIITGYEASLPAGTPYGIDLYLYAGLANTGSNGACNQFSQQQLNPAGSPVTMINELPSTPNFIMGTNATTLQYGTCCVLNATSITTIATLGGTAPESLTIAGG